MKITHTEKIDIISRLIDVPKTNLKNFWGKEIKIFNRLYRQYPNFYLWDSITFSKKFDSLLALESDYPQSIIKKKFLEFNFEIKNKEKIILSNKYGEDFQYNKKPKTIKEFLNE